MTFSNNTLLAESKKAKESLQKLSKLQEYFSNKLSTLSGQDFNTISWLRNSGSFGGGHRRVSTNNSDFNQATINISQVQYENEPSKKLSSASALSCIIHPANPHAPSIHLHISWTEFKNGTGYWRMMADLNPSIVYEDDKQIFDQALKIAGDYYKEAHENGEKYFTIPSLNKKRGVSHFYLEGYTTEDFEDDISFANRFGLNVIDTYCDLFKNRFKLTISDSDLKTQLEYHTLYFYQVTTLDRGTIAGILVHNENDVGIMGSLPNKISVDTLKK